MLNVSEKYAEILSKHVDIDTVSEMVEWLLSEPEEIIESLDTAFTEMTTLKDGGKIKKFHLKKILKCINLIFGANSEEWVPLDLQKYYEKEE